MDTSNANHHWCKLCFYEVSDVLKETSHFVVLKPKSPFGPDHVIVVSKSHYTCMAQVPLEFFEELKQLKNEVLKSFKKSSQQSVAIEYGRMGHFHLNIISLSQDISETLNQRFHSIYVEHLDEISKLFETYKEYILYENQQGEIRYYIVDELLGPHFLKSLFHNPAQTFENKASSFIGALHFFKSLI